MKNFFHMIVMQNIDILAVFFESLPYVLDNSIDGGVWRLPALSQLFINCKSKHLV